MENFVVLPDLTCDLSAEIRSDIGLADYIPGYITFPDGRDFDSTLDWEKISRTEFYHLLSAKNNQITTAPPSIDRYEAYFEKYVSQGIAVLSMSISSKISSTFGNAEIAAKNVLSRYPQGKIYCFDSLRMSGAFGVLVCLAQQKKNEGASFEETCRALEDMKLAVHQMGPIDDLTVVARRGNISMGKAIFGNFAGIKPLGDCNADGYVTVLGKAKGIKNALNTTVDYMQATAAEIENQTIIIAHSDRKDYAEYLKQQLEARLAPAKIYVTDVFCGSAVHIGPGMIGAYYLGEATTLEMNTEKELMTTLLEQ